MHELLAAVVANTTFVNDERRSREGEDPVRFDRPQSIAVASLYERIGGDGPLLAAVDGFYKRLMADDRVSRFFANLSMEAQVTKQLAFMSRAMGGPKVYRGRDLGDAHRDLVRNHGLGDEHFDIVAQHLRDTLEDLEVVPEVVDEVMAFIETTRPKVLDREGTAP